MCRRLSCIVTRSFLVFLEIVTEALFVLYLVLFCLYLSFPSVDGFPLQVGGVVETNRPDTKNAQYQACIKQGDLLLNRVQKLGRVVEA